MNAISNVTNVYSVSAGWGGPPAGNQPVNEFESELGDLDAYDASLGSFDVPASLDEGDGLMPTVEECAPPERLAAQGRVEQAAEINGEMWLFSAGSGAADGAVSDWGPLAGL